ncbi:indoleamine 2,3-dioxygenase 2-like [Poecilia latipinna]|uniref:Indoleamine 2,3-dioxygenase 2-like n=2 Tax=Poecilia TaxID=8080 RepID=A0A087YHS6_POEFO|nr:PREDICTED: indoleamine 2,3-dioxygenase 2-like [Poecilia formosa]XP_014891690.1 PREDICTED: indoleamine 2,3-dioxygenase 2-like [Poecilia latipinna]
METNYRETLQADFDAFDISEELGFILEEPLTHLPDYYRVWLDLANNLTHLIESRKLRDVVHKMPILSPHHLSNHRELRLAHLALGFISMGYVWQEGQHEPAQILPKALAWPYWLISRRIGLPPILTYADSVLANWKLKDPTGDMEIGNMDLIFSFPGGETCRGFFMVSLLVEMAASSGITGSLEVMHAVKISDLIGIQKGLIKVTQSLKKMKETFQLMHNHVEANAFHGTLRIFVSGWRDNPMLPRGLLYEGVSNEPVLLSGGSAAQSSAIQCFDALLCIQHEGETGAFLTRMRDYMPPAHRQLIETLSVCPSLRDFIMTCSDSDLCQAYNSCVSALVDLRSYHLNTVAKYVTVPGNRARAMGCPLRGAGTALNTTGTGGSNLMVFLKTVRNTTQKALILERPTTSRET